MELAGSNNPKRGEGDETIVWKQKKRKRQMMGLKGTEKLE